MSNTGTPKARLEKVTKELEEEMEKWNELGLDISKWRMGAMEAHNHCAIIAMAELIQDKLGVSEDEVNFYLRRTTLKFAKIQREAAEPMMEEIRSEMIRRQITEGIVNPWEKPNNGGPT